jgi:mxaD protein
MRQPKKSGSYQKFVWQPDIFNTSSEGGNNKGATRVLTLKDGGTIKKK